MPRFDSFLFYALIALIAGQLLSNYYSETLSNGLVGTIILFLLPIPLLVFRKTWLIRTIVFYELFILGIFTAAQHQESVTDLFSKNEKSLSRIKIYEVLRANTFNYRYYGKVVSVNDTASSVKVLVTVSKEDRAVALKVGQQLVTKVKPKPIDPPQNPGAFDYAAYLKNKGILAQYRLKKNNHLVLLNTPLTKIDQLLVAKSQAIEKIQNSGLSPAATAHILALIFVERQYIESELREAYARAGLVHLLAISGLHIGIISFFVGWLLLPLHYTKGGSWIRKVILIFMLWGFALLTGLQPAVVRAVTLFSLLHIGEWTKRPQPPLQRIFLSAWILLIIYPPFLTQIGFQLSYIAVLGIIFGLAIAKKIYHPRKKWKRWLWEFTVVCIAAQLALAPLTIYYFNQFPFLFLISNLLVLHLFTLSLIVAVLRTPLLLLDLPMTNALKLYDLLVSVIHSIVKKISSYESLLWDNIYLSQEEVVLLYALLVGAILGWQSKKVYQWNPPFFISLVAVIVFAFSRISTYDKGQLWVLHQPKHTALIWYENQSIHFFSDAPETRTQRLLQDFQREYPAKEI